MVFQILDNKKDCFGIYHKGEFIYDRLPHDIAGTWNYSGVLSGMPIDYGIVYASGKPMDEVCQPVLKQRLQKRLE